MASTQDVFIRKSSGLTRQISARDSAAVGGSVTLSSSATTAVRNCTTGTLITITVNVTDGTNALSNAGVDVRDASGREFYHPGPGQSRRMRESDGTSATSVTSPSPLAA